MCKPGSLLLFIFLSFLIKPDLTAQSKLRPSIRGEYPSGVFVVTNRVIDTLENGNSVFTNKVDTAAGLKFVKVTFKDNEWFAEKYAGLDDLLENPAPYSDWAVWVHGDGQSFLLSMKRALEIQYLHNVNFIVFSWPTKAPDKGPIGNFKNSRKNALETAPYLRDICMELQEYRSKADNRMNDGNLSIFFHSLANQLLERTLDQGYLNVIEPELFDNLILNAAAVESSGHNRWVEKLDIQDRIYIAYNDKDINLEGLRVLSSLGVQLGERPVTPYAKNALYVDFTEAVGSRAKTGATHSYYYELITEISPNIRAFYRELFHGCQINFEDMKKFDTIQKGLRYKIRF